MVNRSYEEKSQPETSDDVANSPIEEDIKLLNDLNQEIAQLITRRNNLIKRVRESKTMINRQVASIQESQYEFETNSARYLVEDDSPVAVMNNESRF